MAERKWEDLNRTEKLANIMFPHLAPKEIQEEMKQLAANEGKPNTGSAPFSKTSPAQSNRCFSI